MIKRPRGKPIMTATLKTGEVAEFFFKGGVVTMYAGWDNVTEKQTVSLVKIAHALCNCLDAIAANLERRQSRKRKSKR